MVRETIVDMACSIFIPLRVGFAQFCVTPEPNIFLEGNKCTDVTNPTADATTEGGDTDVIL